MQRGRISFMRNLFITNSRDYNFIFVSAFEFM